MLAGCQREGRDMVGMEFGCSMGELLHELPLSRF